MLRNFIITSLRILWRNKVVSAINILSLSIGITAFILILLYVHHETSYDKFFKNYDQVYRLEGDEYAQVPYYVGEFLRDKIPEIEEITQLELSGRNYNFFSISANDPSNSTVFRTERIIADSATLRVLAYPFVIGNPQEALKEPYSAVLTESAATKLFGNKNPIGETVVYDNLYRANGRYQVTGVIRDVSKSHLPIEVLVSNVSFIGRGSTPGPRRLQGTYLLLAEQANTNVVAQKINKVLSAINDPETLGREYQQFHLIPLEDIYLRGKATKGLYGKQGNAKLLWSFLAIGMFILLLAIINYTNLTTARSILRAKEVVLKKVVGSSKAMLSFQFIAECILLTFISFLIAFTSIQLLVPEFNQLANVHINLSEYNTLFYWSILLVAILLTGFLVGIYPAIMMTSFRSVTKIQGQSNSGVQGVLFRRILLTFQFSISIILIIGILTNLRQLHFARNTNPGFDKEQVLLIKAPGQFEEEHAFKAALKERLLQHAEILAVTSYSSEPLGEQYRAHLEIDGIRKPFQLKLIDPDYNDVMGIDLLEGRNFSWDRLSDRYLTDDGNASEKFHIIVNETAAREYWSESPVGQICYMGWDDRMVKTEIIGVVDNVHFQSMHHKVEPMYFMWRGKSFGRMNVKISPTNIPETISTIEKEWKEVYGEEPFVYSFLDDVYEQQYTSDERAAKIIGYFTIIAIAIACMGLFALSSFMAVRRTKEIGIRKALGASSKTIFVMLSREYIKWILLAALIASPIAWYAMNKWLETFAYRIELGPGVFILAAILALGIGLITVGWQALKSAVANPVEALRYE